LIELGSVYQRAREFDIIHNHVDYYAFPFAQLSSTPTVSTLHGRLDLRHVQRIHAHFAGTPLVSISDAQRAPIGSGVNWVGTVYHGLNVQQFTFRSRAGTYLAYLGRLSFEKRPDRAIEIAKAVDMPLRLAAKVDPADEGYFQHAIKPLLDHPLIEFVGEINDEEKDEFLGNAYAYIFPIDWPEPFGLTVIEAMATGTPVIAMECGAVPELVVHGQTGLMCKSITEMIEAVPQIPAISREVCRRHVEEAFNVAKMTANYEAVYQKVRAPEEEAISA